ncbi:O-antigen ligase [Chryseobacterium sp. WLY505]|uniref:O-antigen ligase family protein n=1 Tax=Chryseobacterium sp. WLY505 TaxID=3068892 RepID=UPI002796C13E|nr:O-antigen ligase family protein [Chryseobacterium sp. WLY505]MDQ1855300.1 O-antigen ligase family protein [Chryseobacterium sp. WLY505]
MELTKKSDIWFTFLLTFGYIFSYSFAVLLEVTSNNYFVVPFRIIVLLLSFFVIYINFDNIKKRKVTVIFTVLFWIFYLCKAIYSFENDLYLPHISQEKNEIYIRIIFLNLIPYIAILGISFTKEIMTRLNSIVFNFLLIILGISCLWTIFIFKNFEKSSGIFVSYYINVGHYGLSLLIMSVYYYFQAPEKLLKPVLGTLVGVFTIFSSSARSPVLAVFIILLIVLIYLNKLKYWIFLLSFVVFFVISIYFLKQTLALDFEFINRMYNAIFEGNGSGRSYYLLRGWNIFKDNVIFGGRILFEDGMYPHNIFIEVLMSMGIVGGVLFLLYFKDIRKFKVRYVREHMYYLPFFLFFIQYCVLVLTSVSIFGNMEFWSFSAIMISIILFCYDEEIKSNDSRRHTAGNH